jgi:hypothetical protein
MFTVRAGNGTRDHTDLTDFVHLAGRLSVPADDAIRQFIDRIQGVQRALRADRN